MKIIKKIIVKIVHFLGYDVIRISKDYNRNFIGLNNLSIKSIIDVGANRGQFAREAIKAFPNASIYCFEPGEKAYLDLKKWADAQNGRVSVFNLALGDKEADLNFYEYLENDEGSSFLRLINPVSQTPIVIRQTTLDKFINNLNIPLEPEILIKIDTQGYDDRVIAGAKQTLSKSIACIAEVIFDREYHDQGSFKKIYSLLDALGFEFVGNKEQHLSKDGDLMWSDSVFKKVVNLV
ncbi:MAG: FkbM family methyltransferase [bacterium]